MQPAQLIEPDTVPMGFFPILYPRTPESKMGDLWPFHVRFHVHQPVPFSRQFANNFVFQPVERVQIAARPSIQILLA